MDPFVTFALSIAGMARDRIRLLRQQDRQAGVSTEYVILVAIVAVAALTAIGVIGAKIIAKANSVDLNMAP